MLQRVRGSSIDLGAAASPTPSSSSSSSSSSSPRIPLLTIVNNNLKRLRRDFTIQEDTAYFACNVELDCLDKTSSARKGYFAVISSDSLLLYRQSRKTTHAHHRVLIPLPRIVLVTKKNEFTVCVHLSSSSSSSSSSAAVSFSTGDALHLDNSVLELAFLENNVYNIDPFLQRMALARRDTLSEHYFSPQTLEHKLQAVLAKVDVTSQTAKLQVLEAVTKESANIDNQAKVALAFKLLEIAICCVSHYGDGVPAELESDLVAHCEFLHNSVGTFARCVRYISQTVDQIGELNPKGAAAGRTAIRMLYGISDSVAVRMSQVERDSVLGQEPLLRVLHQLETLKAPYGDRLVLFQKETLDGLGMTANNNGGGQKKFYEVLSLGFQHPLRRLTLLRAAQSEFQQEDPRFVADYIANVERLSHELNLAVAANDLNMDRIEMMVKGANNLWAPGRQCLANEMALWRAGGLHGKLLVFDDCIVFATVSNSLTKFHSVYELALQQPPQAPGGGDIVLRTKLQRTESFFSAKPELKACVDKLIREYKPTGVVKPREMPSAKTDSFLSRLSPAAFVRGASPRSSAAGGGGASQSSSSSAASSMMGGASSSRAGSSGNRLMMGGGASFTGRSGGGGGSTPITADQARLLHRLSSESKSGARARTPTTTTSSGAGSTPAPRQLLARPVVPSATPLHPQHFIVPAPSPMQLPNQNAPHNHAYAAQPQQSSSKSLLQRFAGGQ